MSDATSPKTRDGHFTYGDYRSWPENERWELVKGDAWAMSPAPSWGHQELSIILSRELSQFLKGKPCRPFTAAVDVFLPEAGEDSSEPDAISTVVQPDLGVVCDSAKIHPRGVMGAPDLVMEIISPSSVLRDLNLKKELYARHGCREYWIWDTRLAWVTRYVLQATGGWDAGVSWGPEASAESQVLPGLRFILPELRDELGLKD